MPSLRLTSMVVLGALALASGVTAVVALADGDSPPTPCRPRLGEKLGVTFHRMCPSDRTESHWISDPLPCGQGAHDTVACPVVTALARDGSRQRSPTRAQFVAMSDAFTAHRLCAMRFAGRLPTSSERASARNALGLATLLATEGADRSGQIGLSELPEWVAEGDCDNPSLPSANCRFASYPRAPLALPLSWAALRSCDAVPITGLDDRAEVAVLGGTCRDRSASPFGHAHHEARTCVLASPGTVPFHYELSCRKPKTAVHAPSGREPVAAIRCVLQSWALGRIVEQ